MTQLRCAAWYLDQGDLSVAASILRMHPALFEYYLPILRAAWIAGALNQIDRKKNTWLT